MIDMQICPGCRRGIGEQQQLGELTRYPVSGVEADSKGMESVNRNLLGLFVEPRVIHRSNHANWARQCSRAQVQP